MQKPLFSTLWFGIGISLWWLLALPHEAFSTAMSFESVKVARGKKIDYGILIPPKLDPDKMVLVLPPGAQTKPMAEMGMAAWLDHLTQQNYFVVVPLAPEGVLFFRGSEKLIPSFLKRVRKKHQLPKGRFHLVGLSNGGISAFRVATLTPDLFRSLVALPGFAKRADLARLDSLGQMPVTIFVGAKDTKWMAKANDLVIKLRKKGSKAEVKVVGSTGHRVFQAVAGEQLTAVFRERSLSY